MLDETEQATVQALFQQDGDLQANLQEALPTLPPRLIVKLRQSGESDEQSVRTVAQTLENLLDAELTQAKETLKELLNAGEIRKLDSLIGRKAREGLLNVAFFNVLTVNLQSCQAEESGEGEEASRAQILQHLYTRCQEEVEKTIPPGTALLNKLLRTDQEAIRRNIYQHYLTPAPNTITAPDGKTVELGVQPVLVALTDFLDAIGEAVKQIREVEHAGGTSRETAANMVESCRTIAKEARIVIGESYGTDSEELRTFESGLQPVFRPRTPDSPYV